MPVGGVTVVDAEGTAVHLPRPARRIVSLVPSATQSLVALGAGDLIVGRTEYDDDPALEHIASVGGGIDPRLETLVALEPDVVIRFGGEQDPRTPARLESLGIPHVAIRPVRIEDVYSTIQLLGQLVGRTDVADSIVRTIESDLEAVQEAAASKPRLKVAHILGGTPPWVTGPGTFIDEVVTIVGGDNVFSDLAVEYGAVSPEVLRSREIDAVLVSVRGTYDERLTPGARIVEVGGALDMPGPDLAEQAARVAHLLHNLNR